VNDIFSNLSFWIATLSLIGSIFSSWMNYKCTKDNNKFLMYKIDHEQQYNAHMTAQERTVKSLISATNEFNDALTNYDSSSYSTVTNFRKAYLNLYILLEEDSQSDLISIYSLICSKKPLSISMNIDPELDEAIDRLNDAISKKIAILNDYKSHTINH
jgi:hypothetical protein